MSRFFEFDRVGDFEHLKLDKGRSWVTTGMVLGEHVTSFATTTNANQPSWRLRTEQNGDELNEGKSNLQN